VFFARHGDGIVLIGSPEQRGLLKSNVRHQPSFLATSIDGCAVFKDATVTPSEMVCVLEFKTATTASTKAQACERLAAAQAVQQHPHRLVFRTEFGSSLFRMLVWTPSYRAQLLHHATTTGMSFCLFVVASLSTIVYAVFVHFPEEICQKYEQFLRREIYPALQEFQHSPTSALSSSSEFGHAVDIDTVLIWQNMANGFVRDGPRPPASDVVPFCVSKWNHCKGGQDVSSRILKNVKVDFRKLSPRGFIWIRFLMTAMMNAHMLVRLLEMEPDLHTMESYKALKQALNHRRTFREFLLEFFDNWRPNLTFARRHSDVAMIAEPIDPDDIVETGDRSLPVPPKRNRLQWLQSSDGKRLRLSKEPHHRGSRKQRKCILCKETTTVYCKTCDLNVCGNPAFGMRKACWEKLHSRQNLVAVEKDRFPGNKGRRGRSNPLQS
jgi:hypothetical protein